jgi:hypothetical protein
MRITKTSAIGFLVLVVAGAVLAQQSNASNQSLEQRAIGAAKQVSAKELDRQLPEQSFEKWFQEFVGANVNVTWEANDCGEQSGDPATTPADPPLCAQASALVGDEDGVTVMIAVGTYKKGISGKPAVFYAAVDRPADGVSVPVKALHELAEARKKLHP